MDDNYKNKKLTEPLIAKDGKQIITLEELLERNLRKPESEAETFRENSTSILKRLGITTVGVSMTRRTTKWLRANGYYPTHHGQIFKFALKHPPNAPYHVV